MDHLKSTDASAPVLRCTHGPPKAYRKHPTLARSVEQMATQVKTPPHFLWTYRGPPPWRAQSKRPTDANPPVHAWPSKGVTHAPNAHPRN